MPSPLRLMTLNIEGDKHRHRFGPFVQAWQPDVLCLQEVFGDDVPRLAAEFGMHATFAPMIRITAPNRYGISQRGEWGVALLSRVPHTPAITYYKGDAAVIPEFVDGNPNSVNRAVIVAQLPHEGETYTFATTHFTWTGDGNPSDEQFRDQAALMDILSPLGEYILCGDLNAPRGRAIFTRFSEQLHDNVPPEVTTTIDGSLHYAGKLELVVDAIFSTPSYAVADVHVHTGLSDHCGLTAEVTRV